MLKGIGVEISLANLEIGNYVIGDIVCERIEIHDYVESLVAGSRNNQLYNMSYNFPLSFLLVEGSLAEAINERHIHRYTALSSYITSVLKRAGEGQQGIIIPIFTDTKFDTVAILKSLDVHVKKNDFIRAPMSKRNFVKSGVETSVLQSFPNIGDVKAAALLEKYGTLQHIFSTPESELAFVIGEKTAVELLRIFNGKIGDDSKQ